MESGNNVELSDMFLSGARLLQNILECHLVGAGFSLGFTEGTEFTPVHANVRRIDVHIPDEIDPVTVLFVSDVGRHATQSKQVIRPEEGQAVSSGETMIGENFFFNLFDSHVVVAN